MSLEDDRLEVRRAHDCRRWEDSEHDFSQRLIIHADFATVVCEDGSYMDHQNVCECGVAG
jgi:hypothetical protein